MTTSRQWLPAGGARSGRIMLDFLATPGFATQFAKSLVGAVVANGWDSRRRD